MNTTMKKFGYPESLIKDYRHWVILLRPQQTTLGALVLICKDDVETFSQISCEAFSELKEVTTAIENHLGKHFGYDKINYLMLMMVDRDVHFHVLPRYAQPQVFSGTNFVDSAWPGPPDLTRWNKPDETVTRELLQKLREVFTGQSGD